MSNRQPGDTKISAMKYPSRSAGLEVRSPVSGAVVGTVNISSSADVAVAAARVRSAQPAWEAIGPAGRARVLARWGDWVADHREEIEAFLVAETGKAPSEAAVEVPGVLNVLQYFGRRGERFLRARRIRPDTLLSAVKRASITYKPYPVVGVISPWNYPVFLSFVDAIPALVAGCAVIIKPAEATPLAVERIFAGWQETGAPDVLGVVHGSGDTGGELIDVVDYVQFTGSVRTGQAVMSRAARRTIPVALELGGKDPMLVLDDADVKRAANAAVWGAMFNAGQTCVSVERVYVCDPVYDQFVELVTERVRALRIGSASSGSSADVGAMIDDRQCAVVEQHITQAIDAGARVVVGGRRRDGLGSFFEPTVLVDVDHSMLCMTDETFGPLLPVMRVANEDEAVRLANESPYGLSASVWSTNGDRALRVADRLDAGAININDVLSNVGSGTWPMGGWKSSGVGSRLGGAHGVRKYCRERIVLEPRLPVRRSEPNWYSSSERTRRLAMQVLLVYANRGRRRLRG